MNPQELARLREVARKLNEGLGIKEDAMRKEYDALSPEEKAEQEHRNDLTKAVEEEEERLRRAHIINRPLSDAEKAEAALERIRHRNNDDSYTCVTNNAVQAYQECYYEWWRPNQKHKFMEDWKKKYPYSREQFYARLNANSDQPWRAINASCGAPPNPRFKSVTLDLYYGHDMVEAGMIYEWYCKYGHKFGIDQRAQLDRRFSEAKSTAVALEIAKNNAFDNITNNILPTGDTMNKVYAGIIIFLIVAGIGGSASLVHELRK